MAASAARRELRWLTEPHHTTLPRQRTDDPTLPRRLHSLFFAPTTGGSGGGGSGRKLVAVHADPPIYTIPHFLSPRELDHMDELITRSRAAFKHSHTDGSDGAIVSEERTSVSLPLHKGGDAILRAIEARAAELVGLPSDHVEPLQVVHYSHGARFDMHHDLAPIEVHSGASDDSPSLRHRKADRVINAANVTVEAANGPADWSHSSYI